MTIKPIIYCCPICKKLYSHYILLSGNTFGAIFYSDGFVLAPMLPNIKKLTRCNNCKNFFRMNDSNEITDEITLEYELPPIPNITMYDYNEYLNTNSCLDLEDEIFIRTQLRYSYNHSISYIEDNKALLINNDNLQKLINLYTCNFDKPKYLFTVAEIYRNLHNFNRSIELFQEYKKDFAKKNEILIIDKLIEQAKQHNHKVIEL